MSVENAFAKLFHVMYFVRSNDNDKNLMLAQLKMCLIKQDQEDTENPVEILENVYLMILYITANGLNGDIVMNSLEALLNQ